MSMTFPFTMLTKQTSYFVSTFLLVFFCYIYTRRWKMCKILNLQ